MSNLREEEIINNRLDEERMIEIIQDLLTDPFHYFSKTLQKDTVQIYALSISVLLDLYNQEKKKNKELQNENLKLSDQKQLAENGIGQQYRR